jgi:hypothetical protein
LFPVRGHQYWINMHAGILQYGLESDGDAELQQTAYRIMELDDFLHENQGRSTDLFPMISNIITTTGDKLLHGRYICTLLRRKAAQMPVSEASRLIEMGTAFFQDASDHVGEGRPLLFVV